MAKFRSVAATLAVAFGVTLIAGGTFRAIARPQDPSEARPAAQAVPKPETRAGVGEARERRKDALLALFGNMRPLIEDEKGVRFQSREAVLYKDGTAQVFVAASLQPLEMKEAGPPLRHEGPIRELTYFEDDRLLVTGSDGTVKLWDALTGELRKAIDGQFMSPLFFSRGVGGGRFATVDVAGKAVTLWDAKTLEPVATIRPEGSPRLIGAGLSKDGRTLATIGEDHSVTLRDAAEGKPFATLRAPTPVIGRVFVDARWTDRPVLQLDDPFWDSVRPLLPTEPRPAG